MGLDLSCLFDKPRLARLLLAQKIGQRAVGSQDLLGISVTHAVQVQKINMVGLEVL